MLKYYNAHLSERVYRVSFPVSCSKARSRMKGSVFFYGLWSVWYFVYKRDWSSAFPSPFCSSYFPVFEHNPFEARSCIFIFRIVTCNGSKIEQQYGNTLIYKWWSVYRRCSYFARGSMYPNPLSIVSVYPVAYLNMWDPLQRWTGDTNTMEKFHMNMCPIWPFSWVAATFVL